jgi:hypothetical protein
VPGGLVRKEDNGCYDLGWLRGTLLESFEGARQPGVTTPFTLPAVSAAASTSAASPAPGGSRAKGSANGVLPPPTAPTVPANAPAPPAASATNSNSPAPVLAPSGTAGELLAQYNSVSSRATRVREGVAAIEQRLKGQGFALRTDIRDARNRLDTQLQAAMDAIRMGNSDQAEENLRYAENALSTIERFLGR